MVTNAVLVVWLPNWSRISTVTVCGKSVDRVVLVGC